MKRIGLLIVLGVVAACSDYNLSNETEVEVQPAPNIVVDPGSLVFSELSSGEIEVKSFYVSNDGASQLTVSGLQMVAGGQAFKLLTVEPTFELAIGEQKKIDVQFSPATVLDFGQILVLSNDPDTPEVPVDLSGQGSVPELEIVPSFHDFGEISVPCGDMVELSLNSIGKEDLTITELDYISTGLMTLDATMLEGMLPLTLAPGASARVWVNVAAADQIAETGTLEVTSNDPRGVVAADQTAEGIYGADVADQFTEPGIVPVDVLWLIDQSCSMESLAAQNIINGVPSFLTELQQVADWQLLQVTQQDGCGNGGTYLDPTTPNAATLLSNNAFNVAIAGQWTEQLFAQAGTALSQSGAVGCNAGFLRPGAMLHILFASDEPEQSGINWTTALTTFQSYVTDPSLVMVSGILNVYSDNACSGGNGGSPAGYEEIVNATGGAMIDICAAGWGAQMTDIAQAAAAGIRVYNLSQQAIEATIEVQVNGVVTTDWVYTAGTNSIEVLNPPIGEGDIVDVTYSEAADCP